MNNKREQNNLYLAVAFAILWVSFASIIQFHMERIHGETLFGNIEFIKTENKISFKKNSTLSFKIDFNSGTLTMDADELRVYNYAFLAYQNFSPKLIQAHLEIPKLRGPPLA
jgi:hypothetical protein